MSVERPDIAIIGAGILGLSAAYHLSRAGLRVLVIERERSYAMHASGKTAGMFRQLYRNQELTNWARRSKDLWPEASRDAGFLETGSAIVGRKVPDHNEDLFVQTYLPVQAGSTPVVYTPSDGLITPSIFMNGIYTACDTKKVQFLFSTRCVSLKQTGSHWEIQCDDGSSLETSAVINAAGAWVNEFLEPHANSLVINADAYARHLVALNGFRDSVSALDEVGFYWEENADWYARRWSNDAALISICDTVAADPDTFEMNPDIINDILLRVAQSTSTTFDTAQIGSSWFCFRTYTEDQLPVWGPDPDVSNFYWLAAFGGFGISTGFAAAADLCEGIIRDELQPHQLFSPRRVRTAKRRFPLPEKSQVDIEQQTADWLD